MNICSLLFCYILRKLLHVDIFCLFISLFLCLFIYLSVYLFIFAGNQVTTRSLPFLLAGWILLRTSENCKSQSRFTPKKIKTIARGEFFSQLRNRLSNSEAALTRLHFSFHLVLVLHTLEFSSKVLRQGQCSRLLKLISYAYFTLFEPETVRSGKTARLQFQWISNPFNLIM